MKRYILLFFFLAGTIFSVSAQEQTNLEVATNTTLDCENYKNGYFVIKDGLLGKKYTIKRQGSRQVETDPDGTKFIFDVNWIDDCTYTLELRRIARNPNNVDWQEGQIITVSILGTTDKGYIQKSSSNYDELTFERDVVQINHQAYKKSLKYPEDEDLTFNQ